MRNWRTALLAAVVAMTLPACGPATQATRAPTAAAPTATAPGGSTVQFLDRTIDLQPYLAGFPYGAWNAQFDAGTLLYRHTTQDGVFLMMQPLPTGAGLIDPQAGRRVNDVDWSQRNLWGMRYDSIGGDMIVQADERNDEIINLYRLSLRDGSMTRLTDADYVYGFDFSPDGRRIAYITRHGTVEPRRNCLHVLELATRADRQVLCEQGGEHRLTWSSLSWQPDGQAVVVRVNRQGDRKQGNLAYINLGAAAPRLDLLLPDGVERFQFGAYTDWIDDSAFYYISDHTGYANLYRYDVRNRQSTPVTRVEEEASFTPLEIGGRNLVLALLERPHETEARVIDPATGSELGRRTFDATVRGIGFDDKNRFYIARTSAASPFEADEAWVEIENGRAVWRMQPRIRLPEPLASQLQQCNVERVEYPTMDTDLATGRPRMLHAFLLTPKRPLPNPADRLAGITAFYGGGNVFSIRQQIYCEAGISWLSPAVRGSAGFGAEFMALNDGDLGGDEIVDLFYGARFLEQKLGLEPHQIGVEGGSHGGFATMRALTFPPHTNERNERYGFGFGISHAGFSSILTFFENTNIPDWILLEAGDPATERDRLLDRSPLTHVARLQAPLLLTHGSNDNRVGVQESRQFYEAARALDLPVRYVEFEGQGHSIVGLPNQVRLYQVHFDFLEDVVRQNRARRRSD